MADVLDILEIDRPAEPEVTRQSIFGKPKKIVKKNETIKKPEGMARELFNLILNDASAVETTPLFPSDSANKGYKQAKAKLGIKKVRPWKWMSFSNPGRTDGAVFHHWRRVADEGKEYPFGKFNKAVVVVSYTASEYQQHLQSDHWTKAETDHLVDLCQRFDLRFTVIRDRWDREKFQDRTVEDLKERYYEIHNKMEKDLFVWISSVLGCFTLGLVRASAAEIPEPKPINYDAEHERKRKEQLRRLFERTPEQLEEETSLLAELRKIEIRKKDRDRKTQDLQKLITAADVSTPIDHRKKLVKKATNLPSKTPSTPAKNTETPVPSNDSQAIKFQDFKTITVYARSQRFKLPSSLGQKKIKAMDTLVTELGLEPTPSIATDEICEAFNELRNNLLLVHELKQGLANGEFELQSLRHQYEALVPGKTLKIPIELQNLSIPAVVSGDEKKGLLATSSSSSVGDQAETPELKRRRAAVEQGNILKKMKSRV